MSKQTVQFRDKHPYVPHKDHPYLILITALSTLGFNLSLDFSKIKLVKIYKPIINELHFAQCKTNKPAFFIPSIFIPVFQLLHYAESETIINSLQWSILSSGSALLLGITPPLSLHVVLVELLKSLPNPAVPRIGNVT